ncbi:MAG TPA: histidinol-phosphatase HisJ family protein [Clostridia bacterium]|nr:histidinol-phosphatase HisJ family protein [Clostridia bacterium]
MLLKVPDYHLHGEFSRDSDATLEGHCHRAVKLGIPELALTEHFTLNPDDKNFGLTDFTPIFQEVDRCRELFAGRLGIKVGLEVDYDPQQEAELGNYLTGWDFDFLMGSIHYVKGTSLLSSRMGGKEKEAVQKFIADYLETTDRMVDSGLFQVIGHLEWFHRSVPEGSYPRGFYYQYLLPVLDKMVKGNLVLEVNTSGLRKGMDDTFPSLETLQLFRRLGGKRVTVGSDAHHVEDLGRDLVKAIERVFQAGFRALTLFTAGEAHDYYLNKDSLK